MSGVRKLSRHLWGQKAQGILDLIQWRCSKVRVTGGWLRDRLLESQELNPKARDQWQRLQRLTSNSMGDIDLVISGRSTEELFDSLRSDPAFRSLLRRPPLLVPQRGRRQATVKLLLPEAAVDITSLSDRWKQSDSTDDELLKEDSHHRDTTFNAMYMEVETGDLLDPTGGLSDLSLGLVRSPHPDGAMASVLEDPVRLLRLCRFVARYDFQLHPDVVTASEDLAVHKALADLHSGFRGRVLFEVKKALLLHNQPWRFLELCGQCQVEDLLFGPQLAKVWPGAVRGAKRLGQLLLLGLEQQQISAKSERFRGRLERKRGDLPVPLLMPDWRKLGVWENDWLELLLACMSWSLQPSDVHALCERLQLSKAMGENILELLQRAKKPQIAAHTEPPGVHLLHSAACSVETLEDFWRRWPVAPGEV